MTKKVKLDLSPLACQVLWLLIYAKGYVSSDAYIPTIEAFDESSIEGVQFFKDGDDIIVFSYSVWDDGDHGGIHVKEFFKKMEEEGLDAAETMIAWGEDSHIEYGVDRLSPDGEIEPSVYLPDFAQCEGEAPPDSDTDEFDEWDLIGIECIEELQSW